MLFVTFISLANQSLAQDEVMLVKKQRFTIKNFTTFNGQNIPQVDVGWESYGRLNDAKDNVVLITHYFSGTSHAAGKYQASDAQAGYWDAIIGPGKAIDTNSFYVLSADTLVNLNVHDPMVITTGPASLDPNTGKPYGLSFPVVTIRDFVEVQKALLESLGIEKLYAVAGPSMGSLQALEWASAYPDRVERVISVIGAGAMDAWTVAALEHWAIPIKLDANWDDGRYYGKTRPLAGLTTALAQVTQTALHPRYFKAFNPEHHPLEAGPLSDIRQSHQVVKWLWSLAGARAQVADANHLLYLVRASQLYLAGMGDSLEQGLQRVKAKSLFLPAENDLILMPYLAQDVYQQLNDLGKDTQLHSISGPMGHLNGLRNIKQQEAQIRLFLASGSQS
ncbi:homoserine O-acetyltransferase [Aliiglaciecola sp. CAU 1673]|uniref:E22 family MetX-like putative esterase n=1 Tax=Aliiglaciecola sp. CAU 1673 TaxID=3032595 RepID=UPI0023DC07A5|nr:homoserine O-acetyltransferase [Aliiglaciecola sp. CAU 1673]MDF2179961.1 homoserine O-acetyltransferase [Aliiglaciecola sp. CAU 1673]